MGRTEEHLVWARRAEALSVASVAEIVSERFRDLRGLRVDFLGEGWDYRAFEVDSRWVFRFPKRESSNARLKMEHGLLAGLAGSLPLRVPLYAYLARVPGHPEWRFGGYRKLPGPAAEAADRVDSMAVARQLGHFLDRLHAYPLEAARAAGVPERPDLAEQMSERARRQLARIEDREIDLPRLGAFLDAGAPAPCSTRLTLVHNDLGPDHVLVDPDSGQARAVIDWSDAVIAEPAADFAGIYAWLGERCVERALEHYTHELDTALIARARYLGICVALHLLTLSRQLDQAGWERVGMRALRRDFASEQ